MELKNETLFFVGIVLVILGSFIVIFDYPQIQFLEMMNSESNYKFDIHQRLIIEFTIGVVVIAIGIALFIVSFLKRFKYRFR